MFYDIVKSLCLKNNMSMSQLAKDLKISKSNITNWKNGSAPRNDKLAIIADYFDVSSDYLLGREQKNKPTAERSELIDKILTICDGLPEGKQTELLEYAKYLVAKSK
jgi:transcriptional regulator with XRE-family HTH domain